MQTSVSTTPAVGAAGDIADLSTAGGAGNVSRGTNAEASDELAFGLMVAKGTEDGEVIRPATIASVPVGVAVRGHDFAQDAELGATGVTPGHTLGVLRRGRVFVTTEDAVTRSSGVHVRMKAGTNVGVALVVADLVFTAEADDDTATSVGHGLLTGDGPIRVANSGGALPTGISAATDYWIIKVTDDTFQFAATKALALAGTELTLDDDGTGTQTLSDTTSTERLVTGLAGAFRGTPDGEPLVVADDVFTADNTTEIFTAVAHGLLTGDGPIQVSNGGGALPTGLSASTNYWVIKIDADTFKLATSRANAIAGSNLLITSNGTGTQTLSDTVNTERLTTLDISSFARWKRSADIGEICELELKMTNASLATVG
jgi:hypothetical protein